MFNKLIHTLNVVWVEPMEITLDWLHACNAFYDVNLLFARISKKHFAKS